MFPIQDIALKKVCVEFVHTFKHRISPVALPSFQIAGDDDQVKYMHMEVHVEVKFMQCHLDNTT